MNDEKKYAVIESGGKQYRVCAGQTILVEKLDGQVGDAVSLDKVLLVGGGPVVIGAPYVEGASVNAKITALKKERKIRIFKKKIKTGYTKRQGHRQQKTALLVESINA